jgi:hypothetical protein
MPDEFNILILLKSCNERMDFESLVKLGDFDRIGRDIFTS